MYCAWIRQEDGMVFLRTLIVAFIVSIVLNVLTKRRNERIKTSSLKKFIIRAPVDFVILGIVAEVLSIVIFCGIYIQYGKLMAIECFIMGSSGALGLLLMLAPVKGFWDIIVDNDDITVVKAFIYKRHWKFSEIEYCKTTRGGIKVYVKVKGRKRKAFFVDAMVEGCGNFKKRVEKEDIPIYYPKQGQ